MGLKNIAVNNCLLLLKVFVDRVDHWSGALFPVKEVEMIDNSVLRPFNSSGEIGKIWNGDDFGGPVKLEPIVSIEVFLSCFSKTV